ncbi:hypothetical protein BHE74_00039158 [Ensete ventricosum]|nr:hypothetical protein BHE74_00039158 [Ensete ventricosum]
MLPLRFPYSGIRTKAARKGVAGHGQVPCRCGRPRPKPLVRVVGHGQGPLQRGCWLRPGQPTRAVSHGQLTARPWLAHGQAVEVATYRGDAFLHDARRQAAYG